MPFHAFTSFFMFLSIVWHDCAMVATADPSGPVQGPMLFQKVLSTGSILPVSYQASNLVLSQGLQNIPETGDDSNNITSSARGRHDNIAVGFLSGRPEYHEAIKESTLRYLSYGSVIELPGKCACNFVQGLIALYNAYAEVDWYYIADEDAVLALEQFDELLANHNASEPTVMSGSTRCHCGDIPGFAHCFYGGTGVFVSRSAMTEITSVEMMSLQKCLYKSDDPADVVLTHEFGKLWKRHADWKFVALSGDLNFGNTRSQGDSALSKARPGGEAAVVHHVSPESMARHENKCSQPPCLSSSVKHIKLSSESCGCGNLERSSSAFATRCEEEGFEQAIVMRNLESQSAYDRSVVSKPLASDME